MTKKWWFPIGMLAIGLFAINAAARLVIKLGFSTDDDAAANRASIVMFALIGLALAVLTFFRAQQVPPNEWLVTIGFGALGGMLLTVLVGPFITGKGPFEDGAGNFFSQIWLYGGLAILGTLLGYWIATALGRDYRSRSLKAYAESRNSKPRRVVGR